MRKALYAFSGDPITFGHIDIIARASASFDKVIVCIGENPDKEYMFSMAERMDMAKRSLVKFRNVEVISFDGLLVDYAYENGIDIIVKGVRNAADFNYENILHQVGESQKLGIDTHILFAKPELAHISSSTVKAIQKEQGLIHEYVPLYVKQCLEARMSGQYIIGVTGEIGAGKSYICRLFSELGKKHNIEVHDIELDHIGHQIMGELKEPRYEEVRKRIAEEFGRETMRADGTINRKILGEIVFNDQKALDKLNEIMEKPILLRLRKELHKRKGLIILNAALISEAEMAHLCNNNIVLVNADKDLQCTRLDSRGLSKEQIQRRLESQFDYKEKKRRLEASISKDNQGRLWLVDNSEKEGNDMMIERVFEEIIADLRIGL